jgi:hypothetical protein
MHFKHLIDGGLELVIDRTWLGQHAHRKVELGKVLEDLWLMLTDFWGVLPCHLEGRYRHFRGTTIYLHSRGGRYRYMVQRTGAGATSQPVACQYSSWLAALWFFIQWEMGYSILCMEKIGCREWSEQYNWANPWWWYLVTNLESYFNVSQFNSNVSEPLQFHILLCVHSSVCLSHWSCCVWFCFRDLVHRQTACAAFKHMALGVYGFSSEDALIYLLNHVWPNIFKTSPHPV